MLITFVLILALAISLYTDIRSRKILNKVTFSAITIGLILNFLQTGTDGLLFSVKGLFSGVGLLLIPFILGGMGAGDVKLMGAIGSLMGTTFVFYTFLYTAIFGGIIALFIMLRKGQLSEFFKRAIVSTILLKESKGAVNIFNKTDLAPSFPYGVAIFLGTIFTYLFGGML